MSDEEVVPTEPVVGETPPVAPPDDPGPNTQAPAEPVAEVSPPTVDPVAKLKAGIDTLSSHSAAKTHGSLIHDALVHLNAAWDEIQRRIKEHEA